MITPQQIKAARSLLNWKQSDLAKVSGISLPSINNIERNIASPRIETIRALQKSLENAGIEFIGEKGVSLREEIFDFQVLEGDDFLKHLYDDIFDCMKSSDDHCDMCGINERKFAAIGGEQIIRYFEYQQKTNFKERMLIATGDTYLLAPPSSYRWISPDLIGTIPYFVYKDRLVLLMWDNKRAGIIRNQSIADSFRKQFEFLWALGEDLPPHLKHKIVDDKFRAQLLTKKKT